MPFSRIPSLPEIGQAAASIADLTLDLPDTMTTRPASADPCRACLPGGVLAVFRWVVLLHGWLLACAIALPSAAVPGTITNILQLRALPSSEAGRPVVIRGVVTYVHPSSHSLFVQDSTAGIS